jgi:integrase
VVGRHDVVAVTVQNEQWSPDRLRPLITIALDTGLRRGEMFALRWADVDTRPGWLRLRGETTKSGKTRWVPVATERLKAVLEYLRFDAAGEEKGPDVAVYSTETGEPIGEFRTAWMTTVLTAHDVTPTWVEGRDSGLLTEECRQAFQRIGLRWHASRLVERGVPLVTHPLPRQSAMTIRSRRRCSRRHPGWRRERVSSLFQDPMSSPLPPTRLPSTRATLS